jgi:phosphoglucomutase
MDKLKAQLTNNPPKKIGDMEVKQLITIDGYKFIFGDNSWLGIRLSGTEPIVRCYIESNDKVVFEQLLKAGNELINS